MRTISQQALIEKFGQEAKCRYWLKNKRGCAGTTTLAKVPWKNVVRVTVLFDKPHSYLIDGDACDRDGVAYIVTPDQKRKK